MEQRFPTPFRSEVIARAKEIGLDPAYVYGLIRQESRFVIDARSGAGAVGLMQIMPATARWTARKTGVDYSAGHDHRPRRQPEARNQLPEARARRLRRLASDGGGGLQRRARAARANGAKGRSSKSAVWAENIPFNETRDYVKKVLVQRDLLRRAARRRSRTVAESAPGPADRSARRERAGAEHGFAMTAGPILGHSEALSAMRYKSRLALGGTGFRGPATSDRDTSSGSRHGGGGGGARSSCPHGACRMAASSSCCPPSSCAGRRARRKAAWPPAARPRRAGQPRSASCTATNMLPAGARRAAAQAQPRVRGGGCAPRRARERARRRRGCAVQVPALQGRRRSGVERRRQPAPRPARSTSRSCALR